MSSFSATLFFVFFFITTFMIHLLKKKRTQVNKLTNYLSPWKPILSRVTEQEQDRCLCTFKCVSVWVCEEKYRTRNLLAYLPQTQSRVGKFGVISIQKIIHCKYIIYIYTYLNIFTNIPSTIHYTVYFFSPELEDLSRELKRNASILQNKPESSFYMGSPSIPLLC